MVEVLFGWIKTPILMYSILDIIIIILELLALYAGIKLFKFIKRKIKLLIVNKKLIKIK